MGSKQEQQLHIVQTECRLIEVVPQKTSHTGANTYNLWWARCCSKCFTWSEVKCFTSDSQHPPGIGSLCISCFHGGQWTCLSHARAQSRGFHSLVPLPAATLSPSGALPKNAAYSFFRNRYLCSSSSSAFPWEWGLLCFCALPPPNAWVILLHTLIGKQDKK